VSESSSLISEGFMVNVALKFRGEEAIYFPTAWTSVGATDARVRGSSSLFSEGSLRDAALRWGCCGDCGAGGCPSRDWRAR
jgi:hypothetical protein